MWDHLSFVVSRLREQLWIKPLIICGLSIGAVLLASLLDMTGLGRFLPEISKESAEDVAEAPCDRVAVPELSMADMFDDAFAAIARDGAATIEVMVRLLKVLEALAAVDNVAIRDAALAQARLALARAEKALTAAHDRATVNEVAGFAIQSGSSFSGGS